MFIPHTARLHLTDLFSLVSKQLANSPPLKIPASLNGIFSHEVIQHFSPAQDQYFLQTSAYQPLHLSPCLNNWLSLIQTWIILPFFLCAFQLADTLSEQQLWDKLTSHPRGLQITSNQVLEHAENAAISGALVWVVDATLPVSHRHLWNATRFLEVSDWPQLQHYHWVRARFQLLQLLWDCNSTESALLTGLHRNSATPRQA